MRFIFVFFIFLFNYQYLGAVEFLGKFEQGSFILGKTKPNSKVKIDNKKIRVSKDGYFAFGLDRDRKNNVVIVINGIQNLNTCVYFKFRTRCNCEFFFYKLMIQIQPVFVDMLRSGIESFATENTNKID